MLNKNPTEQLSIVLVVLCECNLIVFSGIIPMHISYSHIKLLITKWQNITMFDKHGSFLSNWLGDQFQEFEVHS